MSDWIESVVSAWTGHRVFAEWLVREMKPETVVELGVDRGYSSFVFAKALEKENKGIIYGVDSFEGDEHAGKRNTFGDVASLVEQHSVNRLVLVKGYFAEVAKTWDKPVDILHIDGYHTFDAVSDDFKNWSPFVKEDGVVLFHDTAIQYFQIKDFFRQLSGGYKLYFVHSAGLGIFTKNKDLYEKIKRSFGVFDFAVTPF